MTIHDFVAKYPTLSAELYEYREVPLAEDASVAERLGTAPFENGLDARIETVQAIVEQAKTALAAFPAEAADFRRAANRKLLADPATARAWLERMIPIWERVADRLRLMKRAG